MKFSNTGWMAGPGHGPFFDDRSFPDRNTKQEFDLRMRVLLANLANRAHFSAGTLNMATPGNHGVNLAEFSEWAQSVVQWDIPPELSEIAKSRNKPEQGKPEMTMPKSHANVSDKLAKMNQASMKFWGNADRDDRGTHPDNATVAKWLEGEGFSSTLADKAATIIRPEWAPTGRKPEE